MFRLVGRLEGKAAELSWDSGEVTGTPRAVELYNFMLEENDGWVIIPGMGSRDNRGSKDALGSYLLMIELLYPVKELEGEIPRLPSVPDGAIP